MIRASLFQASPPFLASQLFMENTLCPGGERAPHASAQPWHPQPRRCPPACAARCAPRPGSRHPCAAQGSDTANSVLSTVMK